MTSCVRYYFDGRRTLRRATLRTLDTISDAVAAEVAPCTSNTRKILIARGIRARYDSAFDS